VLVYDEGAPLAEIIERLDGDERFAYADVPPQGGPSAVPNDPYFPFPVFFPPAPPWPVHYQWSAQPQHLNLAVAWDRNPGWAHVGILDGGPPVVAPAAGPYDHLLYQVDHFDLQQVVAYKHSWDFRPSNHVGSPGVYPRRALKNFWAHPVLWGNNPHGTHVLGLIAANANNGQGVAGVCQKCSVFYGQITFAEDMPVALQFSMYAGSQVINLSGALTYGFSGTKGLPCSLYGYGPGSAASCPILALFEEWDTTFIAAAGNDLKGVAHSPPGPLVDYPANDPKAIGVGGTDLRAEPWDERFWIPPIAAHDPWDFTSGIEEGCTDQQSTGIPIYDECGTNLDASVDFLAPARKILSTLPVGAVYSTLHPLHDLCNDSNFPAPVGTAGIGYCTGTSMSAPLVSGIAGLIRSVNPLLPRADLKSIMALSGNVHVGTGIPIPDAGAAVDKTYGTVGGAIAPLRLTPMFLLKNVSDGDRLYTTRPQVAQGALSGLYLADPVDTDCYNALPPNCGPPTPAETARPYYSANDEMDPVNEYLYYPAYGYEIGVQPVAAFWVLTSNITGIEDANVRPLYRLSFAEACQWREHIYTTEQAGIDILSTTDYCPGQPGRQSFHYDGIEGYIFRECPKNFTCNNLLDPSEPQKLYRRYSFTDNMGALLLESDLFNPIYSTYATDPYGGGNGFLGYAFPNVDSDTDGLPDGFERLLGMNPLAQDSDGDGCSDGVEYPLATMQPAGRDPLVPQGGSCP
jgi:serine protease